MRDNMRMKKVFSILLCLCMVLSYVPNVAFAVEAEETYNLWVGGVRVTSANALDILGEADDGAVVTYDADTKTLTLNGANLTGGYGETVIYSSESLNVVLAAGSANTLSGQNYGIRVEGDVLTISGTGSLSSTANFDGIQGKSVTIFGGSITATGNASYGIKGSTVAISGGIVTAYGGAHGVEGELTLSGDTHVTITSENNAVDGSLSNTTTGWCRGGNDETFTTTIASVEGNKYFEYLGASHVTYTNKDAQNHTVVCTHGISFDEAHKYENGICTACSCEGGIIDVSILSSDLIITDTGYSMNGKNYLYEGDYTLSGTTSYGVIFDEGEHQLTANNLKIEKGNGYTGSAIDLKNGAKLHLVLAEENTLTGGWEGSGIRVNEGTSLTISGNGILHAGYQRGSNAAYGAAIGGYCNSNFGTIIINGGTIYANGERGASIGSGSRYGTSNTMAGTIVLNGGTIYADLIGTAASSGAVLKGSGAAVYCDSIQADTSELNAIVYSKNGTSATYYCNDFIVTGDVANCSWDQANKVLNINGGNVTVSNTDKNTATSHRIYIQGTANVTLDGVNISSTTGAPVEIRDYSDTNVTLTLSGSNTLISQAANKAAVHKARGQQGTNSEAASLTITGSGSLTAVGGSNAAGIGGGGYRGDTHNIIINSGTIYATGTGAAAGIGSSDDGSTWNIVINGGNITANGQPGIGANTTNWQGQKNAAITGGTVITNSYIGSTPTGGLVSTDGGKNYTAYSDYTLSQNLTIDPTGKLTVAEGATLTIADGVTLTNLGTVVNFGKIAGNLDNSGVVYNMGILPDGTAQTIYEQYVTVNSGSGTGNYAEGSTVTITADAPTSGKMFTGWTVDLGTVTLTDSTKAETTFTMPTGCVIVTANYADVVATITDAVGNVTSYTDDWDAMRAWRENGGTLKLYTDDFFLDMIYMYSDTTAVLDLNGHSCRLGYYIESSVTIKNGTVLVGYRMNIQSNVTATFENVTISPFYATDRTTEISNHGTIVDAGLTLNGVTISGGTIKTGFTDGRVTLVDIPEHGYIYDGTAHEPGVKYGETTLVKGTDYTVTFSNSSGGDSTINAGTVTMSITGIGNYAGTVTRTYTISKATLTVTAENKEITYGDAVPTYTVTYNGFVNGENEDKLGGTLAFVCGYAQFSDKGEYTIKASGYTSDNYIINYVDGKLNVSAKPITVTIQNTTSIYGDEIVALTATDNGIVNNDKDVYRLITTASKTADVGKYDIIGEALDGNYSINFEKGTAAYEITTRKLTVSVVVANKKYDGINTAAITSAVLNNVASNDTVALVNGTATFTSVNVADGIAISLTDFALSGEAEVLKNYTLTQPTGIKANITNDWTPTEYIVSTPNSNGWLNADLVITAKDGYELSLTNTADGVWSETLTGAVEGADSSITFYVRNKADGTISLAKTVNYKLDKTDPTGTVEFVGREPWQEFVSTITFGLFYKDEVTVKITANDTLSGIANIEYYEADEVLTLDEVKAIKNWTTYNDSFGINVEDTKKFVYFVRLTDKAGNVTYLSTDGAEYDTTAPVISGVENGKTYYTTQKVTVTDKNDVSIKLNGEDSGANITLDGNKEATYTIVATDKAGNSTTVTVKMAPVADIAERMNGKTESNVTSNDKANLQNIVDTVTELLKDENLTAEVKAELEQIKVEAEALLKAIEDADKAADTENTSKVEEVTADNVTPDDKSDLEKAKADLEKALDENGGNFTEEEKKAIEDEIQRIDDALEVIENVEAVEAAISDLPETVELDNAETVAKIEEIKRAYDELTDYEKSLVDSETKAKLDMLANAIVAYDIVKGDGSSWTKGTDDSISFTANGPIAKFSGIKIDGKTVDAQHYEVKAGSTIITLKASYLETLAAGEHTITVVYTDGETSGTFTVQAKSSTPATGDDTNILLWTTMLLFSVAAMSGLIVCNKRFAYKAKYVRK